jgi:GNAT superfamily N-acetyltransferase
MIAQIRTATQADMPALVSLKEEMKRAEFASYPPEAPVWAMLDFSREAAQRGVEAYWSWIQHGGGEYFAAEMEGEIIGSVLWAGFTASAAFKPETQNLAMIAGLVVAEKARGQGLGKRLLAHAGRSGAFLEVVAANAGARALYEGAGYLPLELSMIKTLP